MLLAPAWAVRRNLDFYVEISEAVVKNNSANTQHFNIQFKHGQFQLQNLDDIRSRFLQRAPFSDLHPPKMKDHSDLHAYY